MVGRNAQFDPDTIVSIKLVFWPIFGCGFGAGGGFLGVVATSGVMELMGELADGGGADAGRPG